MINPQAKVDATRIEWDVTVDTHDFTMWSVSVSGRVLVKCWELPRLVTFGDSFDEAYHNAEDAAALHIKVLNEDGVRIPKHGEKFGRPGWYLRSEFKKAMSQDDLEDLVKRGWAIRRESNLNILLTCEQLRQDFPPDLWTDPATGIAHSS